MNEPGLYHDANVMTLKDGINHLEEIKSTICWEKGEKILDVGCGPGNFTADTLLKFVPEDAVVVGCDLSKKMINFASSRFKAPRLSFIELDVESSDIWNICARESFSKIHSLYCFHWIENTRAAFQNMYSLLKPGGEIFLVFIADMEVLKMFREVRNMEPWKHLIKGPNYFTMYATGTVEDRKKRITDELIQAGFEEVQVEIKERNFVYKSMDEYLSVIRAIDPWRVYIPQHLEALYNACLVENMIAHPVILVNPTDGKPKLNYKLFHVRSKKSS